MRREDERTDEAPDPIEHAAPDAELVEAQLAAGRAAAGDEDDEAPLTDEELLEAEELEAAENGRGGSGGGRRVGARRGGPGGSGSGDLPGGGGTALAVASETSPERAPRSGSRVVHFLQGSWRELQRVQWPDRRQVIQATGVVIGFVVVAGVFLGVADFVAQKLVNLILK